MGVVRALSAPARGLLALRACTPTLAGSRHAALLRLVDAAAERLLLADQVAAAKFPDAPIVDPARERAVLERGTCRATELGTDPAVARAVLADAIEAGKRVQYGRVAERSAHPDRAPAVRPDLAGRVRPALDRAGERLLRELAIQTERTRPAAACRPQLAAAVAAVTVVHGLDRLHHEALVRTVASVGRRPLQG